MIPGNRAATSCLFLATLAWGASFFLVKKATSLVGVWPFLGYRFVFATVLLALFFPKKLFRPTATLVRRGFVLGILLFLAIWTQTQGLQFTSATRSGFLTALYVPFTPLFARVLFGAAITLRQMLVALVSLTGLYFLTTKGPLGAGLMEWWNQANPGDLWTLATALVSAVHIVITERFSRRERDSIALGMWQFVWCLTFVLTMLAFQVRRTPDAAWNVGRWPAYAIFSVGFNAVFCTAFGFIMQIVAQKHIGSLKAALIFALEAPLASGFAFTFLGEVMTVREFAGAAVVFLTSVIPESWLKDNY